MLDQQKAGIHIRNEVPDAGLLVTADGVGEVPEEVTVDVVERSLVEFTTLGGVLETVPAGADTDGRGEPFADVEIGSEAELAETVGLFKDGVGTGTDTDEGVVEETVGHIGTTDDVTVRIAIAILLRKGVKGEQDTCRSKNTEQFDTFHKHILS